MSSTSHFPTLNASVQTVVHLDIWEALFDQLAFLGYHRTLVNCALTCQGNAWLALRRLYDFTSLSATDRTNTSTGLWETLLRSSTFTVSSKTSPPLTSRPYLSYVRRFNHWDLIFAEGDDLDLESLERFAIQNPQWAEKKPRCYSHLKYDHGGYEAPFLQDVVALSHEMNRRVMLREVSALCWKTCAPLILSCHALERLSLDSPRNLGAEAGKQITENLPRLKHIEFPRGGIDPAFTHTIDRFLSELKADQLWSFRCGLSEKQVPVLRAIAKQKDLRDLELQFFKFPPIDLLLLAPLANLTSLTLRFNYLANYRNREMYPQWATQSRAYIANWLTSCKNLKSLHIFRLPHLIPAVADALQHLQLKKLHVYDTASHLDFYRALRTQKSLTYLFIAEQSTCPPPEDIPCRELVMDAVCSMRDLRDLRLHTSFSLSFMQIQALAWCQPNLEFLSFVQMATESPAWVLRPLEDFKNLKNLTVLGRTKFSAPEILEWIEMTECHRRHGGFSLSLPSQEKASWYRGVPPAELPPMKEVGTDSFTMRIKNLLRFCVVIDREVEGAVEPWHGNDYTDHEERMFCDLWGDVEGARALLIWRGRNLPAYVGQNRGTGLRIA